MKKFAFFLPQFHAIKENDNWWGKGFTEWVNVRNAKPLFKNHDQPKTPLNDYYYNLTDISTIIWQTNLMHKYNIDGFIYYHYYFNGKLLLEKPAEILLNNKNIDQNFFFCWANHSWKRTWNGTNEVLIEQKYGSEEDWEKHFLYLVNFFKDERYEKKDNMPLLLMYTTFFEKSDEMYAYFNKRCIDEGFKGIYIIGTYGNGEYNFPNDLYNQLSNMGKYIKMISLREANSSLNVYNGSYKYYPQKVFIKLLDIIYGLFNKKKIRIYNGNTLFKIMCRKEFENKKIIHGLFFEWDNTPRHGKNGYIITPPNKKTFMKYMKKRKNDEYIFINAWNEWAEGMMLEPTKNEKTKYLEWLKESSTY